MDSERRRKGRRERWRNSGMRPHGGTACLSCSRRTMAEGVFVPLRGQGAVVSASILSFLLVYTRPSSCSFFFFSTLAFIHLFLMIYFWPLWVLLVYELSLVVSSGDCSSLQSFMVASLVVENRL